MDQIRARCYSEGLNQAARPGIPETPDQNQYAELDAGGRDTAHGGRRETGQTRPRGRAQGTNPICYGEAHGAEENCGRGKIMAMTMDEFVAACKETWEHVCLCACTCCLNTSCPCFRCLEDCDKCNLFEQDVFGCFEEGFWTCTEFLSITTA